MALDLDTAIDQIKLLARQAGAIVMQYFESGEIGERTKTNDADILTRADAESDVFLRGEFSRQFPGYGVITEESVRVEPTIPEQQWLIADPLDGTTNYSCNCPFFSISIGLVDSEHRALAGAVYDPVHDELFYGVKGKGSFVEKPEFKSKGDLFEKVVQPKRLKASRKQDLSKCLVVTGYHSTHVESSERMISEVSAVLPRVRCLRAFGSAALEICYVAAGRLDVYYEWGGHIWDVAAGWVIATEAGCVVSVYGGHLWTKESLNEVFLEFIFASKSEIHQQVVELLTPIHTRFPRSYR
jgi:myo-inositol-1(or 4)-monophosphatase